MPTQIPLPTGSYSLPDPNASCRDLINCFAEIAPQTSAADSKEPAPPVLLRRAPGISAFANDGTQNAVRGMWEMAGVLYVVIGSTLYSLASNGTLSKLGTGIAGSGLVRMSDNTACLVIILPGTSIGYTYTTANGLQLITDGTFTSLGAIDLGFDDSYIVFLATSGREFYNCDSQNTSGQGPITFTGGTEFPREFGTDLFVGMAIDHREVCMFGERTSEVYIDAGNATNSPFSSAPDGFIELGALPGAAYCVVKQDQSVFWIANDRTVRRRNGQTPQRVSNHGIEAILQGADITGAYAMTYAIGGHPIVAFTLPAAGYTLCYDCVTTEWHRMRSYGLSYWRPLCIYNAFGKYLVGDSQSGQIGVLDTSVFAEFGTVRSSVWTHQSVYDAHNRISHRRLELVLGGGYASQLAGANANPQIQLNVSDDGGNSFRALPLRSLGARGQYSNRIVWWNLGQSRNRVYQFEVSAPVQTWAADLQATLEGGRY